MAKILIKLKIMPKGIETDLSALLKKCEEKIKGYGGRVHQAEQVPIAFGLKALMIILIADEVPGGTETLETALKDIKDISTVDVLDVRRAIG